MGGDINRQTDYLKGKTMAEIPPYYPDWKARMDAEARVAELEAALQNALLGLTRAREREAEQDATDESMGITLALNRHINTVQAALKGEQA